MSFEKFKPAYLHPKYWLSWLIVGFTWLLAQIPRPWQSGISGWVARRLANSRNSRIRTIRRNIDLCFIEKSEAEREKLVVANLSWVGLRQAMFLSPLYYYIEMGYGILLKGVGLDIIWDSLLGLALLGSLIFSFGVWRFKRQFG